MWDNTKFLHNDFNEKTLRNWLRRLSYQLYGGELMLSGLKWLTIMSYGENSLLTIASFHLLSIDRPIQVISQNRSLVFIV